MRRTSAAASATPANTTTTAPASAPDSRSPASSTARITVTAAYPDAIGLTTEIGPIDSAR